MQNGKIKLTLKRTAIFLIVAATFLVFGYYLSSHPQLITTLTSLDLLTISVLIVSYIAITLANSFVLHYSLLFLRKRAPLLDNVILTGYSSIVNFFGPLQSGPGFRAVYLRKKYDVKLRDFFVTTLIFYGFFALINIVVLAVASLVTFTSPLFYAASAAGALLLCALGWITVRRIARVQTRLQSLRFSDRNFWLIGLGALGVSLSTAVAYFIEIHHVNTGVSLTQAIVYTAAANLSLFVSLTPGAIGIRESFLILSQQLHNIDTTTIIGASVIDRAFYVGFLVVLFIILLVINSRKHLAIFRLKTRE